jgi:mycothiol synthase
MTGIRIRTLCADDVGGIVSVWNQALVRNPISVARFVSMIFGDRDFWPGADCGFWVAARGTEVVGFVRAIVRRCPNDRLGLEPDDGWIPYLAVAPAERRQGVGSRLVETAIEYFARQGPKRAWVCGTPTSAPGSIVPGVDLDGQTAARALFAKCGFAEEQHGYSMSRALGDCDIGEFERWAWEVGAEIEVGPPGAAQLQDLLCFLAVCLPGAWNIAARAKIQSGALHEMLLARNGPFVVGYAQWSGEHFGPFGVAPDCRRQRVGAKLFVEALRRIRAADGRAVWFNWADENARRFYERFGLHVTRRFAVLRLDLRPDDTIG